MKTSTNSVLSAAPRKPLAACCAVLFALAAPEALAANSWIVTQCGDSGTGTLRDTVTNLAQSGDTVDMTALSCSAISLTTGAIAITQASLTLQGPGVNKFSLLGNLISDTILYHSGTGTLFVNDLNLERGNGHQVENGLYVVGGCIFSRGNVELAHSRLNYCRVYNPSTGGGADGGGIATLGNLIMFNSTISGCVADMSANATGTVYGGGAFVGGNLIAKYSQILNNHAGFGNYSRYTIGGGVMVRGAVRLFASTISYNGARYESGGIHIATNYGTSNTATISNSTISGNDALKVGGLYSNIPTTINNSTIAFNHKHAQSGLSAGAAFSAMQGPITVSLHSTLIANNTYRKSGVLTNNDVGTANTSATNTVTFTTDTSQGNFNLIYALDATVSASSLPPDTIIGKCPLLGALKNNGGSTLTHALYSGSPAIDAGVNSAGLSYDQRGDDRHSGTRTDIGAYEFQYTDNIFSAGFEGCP